MRVRIAWRHLIDNYSGNGIWIDGSLKKGLQRLVNQLNKKRAGQIEHWIEEEQSAPQQPVETSATL